MKEQQSGLGPGKDRQYAHKLPPLNQRQLIAARRQAASEAAEEEADQSYGGHFAGIHPEHRPYLSAELPPISTDRSSHTRAPAPVGAEGQYELEEDESYYTTRLPTSARRYQGSPAHVYQQGNRRYHVRYVDVPPRKSRQAQLPPPQRESQRDEYEAVPQRALQRARLHPLAWFGVFLILFMLGWIGLTVVTSWYQGVQNDWTYGKQRHFEVNAVVGHGDSQTNPSHFTAENNNGDIYVIELPGGDASKPMLYQITTVPGNAGNPPVTVSFQDLNRDGKLDMLVAIGNPGNTITIFLLNNGQKFVSKL